MQTSNQNSPSQHDPQPVHIDLNDERNKPYAHARMLSYVLFVLCLFACLSVWIMQNSINAYVLQTYHQPSPLTALDDYPLWKKGGEIGDALYAQHDALMGAIGKQSEMITDKLNANVVAATTATAATSEAVTADNETSEATTVVDEYVLRAGDEIFFAGDSMMQGVAPHVQQYLKKNYNIKSVNLSKQSTGLAYPKFFNWPKTIEETLAGNPNIKILAVFLGPNDPWDMANPNGGGQLKFKSEEWAAEYRARIATILHSAESRGVKVIWITPPNMRKQSLNQQMIYLRDVFNDELSRHNVKVIDSREILGTVNDVYNDYLEIDGKKTKMRTGDGIHFTVKGQKLIAQALQEVIRIDAPSSESAPETSQ